MISWREGQDVCESHGGYLAEVKTENQQTFLVNERNIFLIQIRKIYEGKCCNAGGGVCWPQILVHWTHGLWSRGKVAEV